MDFLQPAISATKRAITKYKLILRPNIEMWLVLKNGVVDKPKVLVEVIEALRLVCAKNSLPPVPVYYEPVSLEP